MYLPWDFHCDLLQWSCFQQDSEQDSFPKAHHPTYSIHLFPVVKYKRKQNITANYA